MTLSVIFPRLIMNLRGDFTILARASEQVDDFSLPLIDLSSHDIAPLKPWQGPCVATMQLLQGEDQVLDWNG